MTKKTLPRGLRNNNPLNIRKSEEKWKGLSKTQSDKKFFHFENIEYGYRAAMRIIFTYFSHYGLNTVSKIISRWAPDGENDTKAYIRNVCERCGFNDQYIYNFKDINILVPLVAAMSLQENGVEPDMDSIYKAYHLAF